MAPTAWPAPNCTYVPSPTTFTVVAGTSNFHTNVHTQTDTVLGVGAESPLFGIVLGDFHPAFQTALLDQSWSFVDALMAQLRGFGVNGAGPGAAAPFGGQLASVVGDELAGGVNIAQAGPDGRMRPSPWFVWVRPHGTLGKVDGSAERFGFRYDIAGVTAGAEYRWPGPWRAGATLGFAHASLTQATTGDKGSIDSLQIGAYGGYRDARTHVVVAALFQQNWISSERLTALSPDVAKASYGPQSYSIGVEAGRKYPVLDAWVQPLASLVFTHLRQGGFTESGTTLLEIAGDARSVNSLKLSLGARAWRDFDLGWGTVTPEFRARWVQDLLNERRAITGRFVGDPSQTAFTVNGAKPTPAAAVIGAGVTLGGGPGFKLAFGYDAEIRANATSHTLQARLKIAW
jgi:outer membrane autotransporter protein